MEICAPHLIGKGVQILLQFVFNLHTTMEVCLHLCDGAALIDFSGHYINGTMHTIQTKALAAALRAGALASSQPFLEDTSQEH